MKGRWPAFADCLCFPNGALRAVDEELRVWGGQHALPPFHIDSPQTLWRLPI